MAARARIQSLPASSEERVFRIVRPSILPKKMTSSTLPGKISASAVILPPRADHSENQSDSDSLVQNDHNTQMHQNVANDLSVSMARPCHVCFVLPRLRLR